MEPVIAGDHQGAGLGLLSLLTSFRGDCCRHIHTNIPVRKRGQIGIFQTAPHLHLGKCIVFHLTVRFWSCKPRLTLVCSLSDPPVVHARRCAQVLTLPEDVFVTSMQWLPVNQGGKRVPADTYVVGCTDGKFRIVSRAGRIDKAVDAHRGTVIDLRVSFDGSALFTGTLTLSLGHACIDRMLCMRGT